MSDHVEHNRRHQHRSGSRKIRGYSGSTLSDVLLRVVDGGLIGVIFVAPLIMGGRHPLGRCVFVVLVVAVALAWFGRQCLKARANWTHSWAELLLFAGLVLVGIQLVPLPEGVVAWLSPQTGEILPAWNSEAESPLHLGSWNQISLAPGLTRGGLAMYLAYGLLFLVTVQRLESLHDVERILRWLAGGVIMMAVLGLVQHFSGNGKFLWVYEHPFRDPSANVMGSFINRNHFAHLLALGIGPLAWWIVTVLQRQNTGNATAFGAGRGRSNVVQIEVTVLVVALAVVLYAALSSLSRGGALAIATSVTVSSVIFWRASVLSSKHLGGLVTMSVLLGGMLVVDGYDRVAGRLDDLTAGSFEQLDQNRGRRMIWEANLAAFQDHWLLGTGVGSHREVYPKYLPQHQPIEYTHAESGPLQVATETGIVGLLLVTGGIAFCVYWCVSTLIRSESRQIATCIGAVAAGLAASVVHSIVDFVWYIPACMSFTVLLAACALRLRQLVAADAPDSHRASSVKIPPGTIPRGVSLTVLGLVLVASVWMIQNRLGPARASSYWDSYLQNSAALFEIEKSQAVPIDPNLALESSSEHALHAESMFNDLTKVLSLNPDNARAHLRMAAVCLRRFDEVQRSADNSMALSQIRDAAIASRFASRAELDEWLARAIGSSRQLLDRALWHARHALNLCPLQGNGYIFLAKLCFLEGGDAAIKSEYVRQALSVRPYDDGVLFEAGKEAMLSGDVERAISLWKSSYHSGTTYRRHLVRLLGGRVPVSFLLENIEPGLADWGMLRTFYGKLNRPDELNQLQRYYLELARRKASRVGGLEAAMLNLLMHDIYKEWGDHEKSLATCEQAFALAPSDFYVRHALGSALLRVGNFSEAEKHLRWCMARKPKDPELKILIKHAVTERVKTAGRKSSGAESGSDPLRR